MFNEALLPAPRNQLNSFTKEVRNIVLETGQCLVELRNGTVVRVEQFTDAGHDGNDDAHFFGRHYAWEANGQAASSEQHDMIRLMS